MAFSYNYPRPALTVDTVVFGINWWHPKGLEVLLIKRKLSPHRGAWALPGGFVNMDETLDVAAARELKEETGVVPTHLEQLYTFGEPKRDPRERIVTVAYLALESSYKLEIKAGSDAKEVQWFPARDRKALPKLAFDHRLILDTALDRLENKIRYTPIGFGLLPEPFTIREMRRLYEIVLDRTIDVSNFRRKVAKFDFVIPAGSNGKQRFRFDARKYESAQIDFQI